MQSFATRPRALLAVFAALALAAAALLPPPAALAQVRQRRAGSSRGFDRGFSDWGDFNDFNWTILQMQRESIASQEERAREAGREKRRDEVEAQQQTEAAARAEYFDSVIEASRAALRSPRGAYYRKPGFVSTEPPGGGNAPSVEVGGILYRYEQGIFWLPQGEQFIVVTAPVGAVVDAPPAGSYRVPSAEGVLHYFFGTFFKEKEGRFAVVAPPPGAVVSYLPDGYVQETTDGKTVYRFGAVAFRPVFVQGILAYQVTGP